MATRQESPMPGKTGGMLAAKSMPKNQVIYYTLFLGLHLLPRFLFHEHHLGYEVSMIKEIDAIEKYLSLNLNAANHIPEISLWVTYP